MALTTTAKEPAMPTTTKHTMFTRRARSTGRPVTVGHAHDLGLCDGGGTTRWYTVCEDHDYIIGHETLQLAESHSAYPQEWCEYCSGNLTAEDDEFTADEDECTCEIAFTGHCAACRAELAETAEPEPKLLEIVMPSRPNPARGWVRSHATLAEPPVPGTRVLIYAAGRHGIVVGEGTVIMSPWITRESSPGGRYHAWQTTFRVETDAKETRSHVNRDGSVKTWEQPMSTFDVEFHCEAYSLAVHYDKAAAEAALPEALKTVKA